YAADAVWDDAAVVHAAGNAVVVPHGADEFEVVGVQTADAAGVFAGDVTIRDDGGASTRVRCAVRIAETAPVLRQATLSLGVDGVTATLSGQFVGTTSESYRATIAWGDGDADTSDLGVGPSGPVLATHVYSRKAAKSLFGRKPGFRVVAAVEKTEGPP